ncbi:tafazzin isoform X2 [Centruroides vittatus]|uniref:tafazzin isoform X2 n=1 Tax=Centruroides vittatus TaxID=120091 RepID=UPI00350F1E25
MHPRDIVWPFPNMNKPPKLFNMGSRIVIPAVGIVSKIFTGWLNNVVVYNKHVLIDAIENRPENVPLITVSNHHSCLDDPMLWGIGRLISECKITPFVIPFYHLGMDCVLPNKKPYIPRVGQVVTVLIGNPIDFSEMREKLKKEMKTAMEKRKLFTDIIQEELRQLKHQTENLHRLIQMDKL